jgi:hypothetical protein
MLWHIWACRDIRVHLGTYHHEIGGEDGRGCSKKRRVCGGCGMKKDMTAVRAYVHVTQHFVLYFCHCGVCYLTEDSLRRHRREDPCPIGFCTRCGESFPSVDQANQHQLAADCTKLKILNSPVRKEVFVICPCAYNNFLAWFGRRFWETTRFPQRFPVHLLKAMAGPLARLCAQGQANAINDAEQNDAQGDRGGGED